MDLAFSSCSNSPNAKGLTSQVLHSSNIGPNGLHKHHHRASGASIALGSIDNDVAEELSPIRSIDELMTRYCLEATVAKSLIRSFVFVASLMTAGMANAGSEFDQAAPTSDQLQSTTLMTEAEIQKKVLEDMKRQCDDDGRCWLMGTDGSGSSWTLGFNAGVGARTVGTGTTVINLGEDSSNNSNDPYYGLSITYRRYNCETNLRVSPAMKRLLETYQYQGVNADGTTKRTFSPADLSLLSLYATLNSKLETCRQTGN